MNKRRAGFTLIELMVAISVFAVFSLLAYGGLTQVLATQSQVEALNEELRDLQMALFRFEQDLEQVRNRPIRDEFGTQVPAVFFNQAAIGGPRLEFTRGGRRNSLDLPVSSLQRIAYAIDEDDQLVRLSWPRLDRGQDAEPRRTVLLREVIDLRFRYLDPAREWQGQWPPEDVSTGSANPNAQPPIAVELTVETKRWGLIRGLYRLSGANAEQARNSLTGQGAGR